MAKKSKEEKELIMDVTGINTNPFGDLGEKWHDKIRGRLKKEGLVCETLDKNSTDKSIDFFVHKKSSIQEGFLCEVKSIISGGFDTDIKAHTSSGDTKFSDAISVGDDNKENIFKKHEFDYDHERFVGKIEERLREALNQYNQSGHVDKRRKAFVVCLCFDFFAGFPGQVDFAQLLEKHSLISAIVTLERDFQREQIKKKHLRELNLYYKNRRKIHGMEDPGKNWASDYEGTQDTVDFKIYLNRRSQVAFKPDKFFKNYILA